MYYALYKLTRVCLSRSMALSNKEKSVSNLERPLLCRAREERLLTLFFFINVVPRKLIKARRTRLLPFFR